MHKMLRPLTAALLVTGLAACSLLPNHRLDYQSVKTAQPVKLPADMKMINSQQAYTLPDNGPLLSADKSGALEIGMPPQLASISQQQDGKSEAKVGPAPDVSQVHSVMSVDGNGYPMIMIHAPFAWAWEYVGTALKASGVKVNDRDRAAGLYYVKLNNAAAAKQDAARIKLSHTTNGIQVVAMSDKGTALLDKPSGHLLLARIYAEL